MCWSVKPTHRGTIVAWEHVEGPFVEVMTSQTTNGRYVEWYGNQANQVKVVAHGISDEVVLDNSGIVVFQGFE
jgi:hypothetical protein